ncbi:MAG TPA: phosphoribosylformylglycinamidine synthase subunit PurL [Planctomycetaceae bacterium]|nr:phosphoribosylformylglycinamidine synthase subunit PurL [Planctomycetaceae bacterium]HCD03297.1 phosphoribosylformylglycinamidine synthase subunit PurL [Planctomycetaceae bacterium]
MLWEIEVRPSANETDREAARVISAGRDLGITTVRDVHASRSFLIETDAGSDRVAETAGTLLVDAIVEDHSIRSLDGSADSPTDDGNQLINVLFKPGVTDNVAQSTLKALGELGLPVEAVATCRKYRVNSDASATDLARLAERVLANDAIEHIVEGPLAIDSIALGSDYTFQLQSVALRDMDDDALQRQSRDGQLYLSLEEMRTIRDHFTSLDRDPTDIELETIAQTWSEHCSHKTLGGRIHYQDESTERHFDQMLKETIFEATTVIRERLGDDDWCVSVFRDNAGIVTFHDTLDVCFKVETHNHPSALEPYGGANTGLGGVIRDPLGTGMGARPVCNTDVFCFARPDTPVEELPPGVLHPRSVMRGVVSGVRDYGNRMGIPTVNGAICFDDRFLGNPLVFCGNVATIPVGLSTKAARPGDLVVTVGGRTGRDGIHGATFSSAELTDESEELSGGAVQIGNAITEKMVVDVVLEARDRKLYSAITDCGAGGFSSAVGEMGEELGVEVWLDRAPLKYEGLSYTEIWISEAQERMVLAVPPENWDEFHSLCDSEGVEAAVIGEFQDTGRLVLKYNDTLVGDVTMKFLHDGRPPVIREAVYTPPPEEPLELPSRDRWDEDLLAILGSLNVCSKEWVIRQYDHEVQAGSVLKPLVGAADDGPSDAAVVRPDLESARGLVVSCGINPHYGDLDPYWMAIAAIDEALRNCIATGADPTRIAILDNFCWGNTERPETLGTLVRAALGCYDAAIAFGTPFISGKDSLNNEFAWDDESGQRQNVAIPSTLLISALGQVEDISRVVSMDLKQSGNRLLLVGHTRKELGGSHIALVNSLGGGSVPRVDLDTAPERLVRLHAAIGSGSVRSCHDLSEGGLAVAAAEMAFAGGIGVSLNLDELATVSDGLQAAELLFSESPTRFLVEVTAESESTFREAVEGQPVVQVGTTNDGDRLEIISDDGRTLVDTSLTDLKQAWQAPLDWN